MQKIHTVITEFEVQSLFLRSNTLHAGRRFGLPRINYTIFDFDWLLTACVRLEADENIASLKSALHDQTLGNDVAVCGFPSQLVVHHVD